jgi:hypothetical protein
MNFPPTDTHAPYLGQLELEMLQSLPCGCVAAVQRTFLAQARMVSIEAKGPHCTLKRHGLGKVLRFVDPPEFPDEEGSVID